MYEIANIFSAAECRELTYERKIVFSLVVLWPIQLS